MALNASMDYFGLGLNQNVMPNNLYSGYNYNATDNFYGTNSIYNSGYNYNPYLMTGMGTMPQNLWNNPVGQMNYQYDMSNTANSFGIKTNAQQISLTDQCNALAQVISDGQEDEIMKEFVELENTLKSQPQYAKCSDQEIKGLARQYFQAITGKSLTSAIEQNASGDFSTGFKKVFSMFGDDSVSKEDLISEINGTKLKRGAEETKIAGKVAGALTYAGVGAGIGAAVTLGNPIGAVVGGIIGAGVGIFKSIFR